LPAFFQILIPLTALNPQLIHSKVVKVYKNQGVVLVPQNSTEDDEEEGGKVVPIFLSKANLSENKGTSEEDGGGLSDTKIVADDIAKQYAVGTEIRAVKVNLV
jgi:hypothetical protein